MASRTIKKQEEERAAKIKPRLRDMLGKKIIDIENNGDDLIFKMNNGYEICVSHPDGLTLSVMESKKR